MQDMNFAIFKITDFIDFYVYVFTIQIINKLNPKYKIKRKLMLEQLPKNFKLAKIIQLDILKEMQEDDFTYKTPIQLAKKQKQLFALALTSKYLCFGIIEENDILFACYVPIVRGLHFQKIFCHQKEKFTIIGFKLIYNEEEQEVFIKDKKAIPLLIDKLSTKMSQRGFHQQYKPIRKAGKGGFATVYQVRRFLDSKTFAAKAFAKQKVYSTPGDRQMIQNQIQISRNLCHKNLLKMYQIFQSQHSMYIVMQMYQGGDLVALIKRTNDVFSAQEVISFMRDMLMGLKYLEDKKIMHRDMKPENVMIRKVQQKKELVIVDFGLASKTDIPKYLLERCGTPGYVSPQVSHFKPGDRLTSKCDVFSLGVIFHLLACRSHLFQGSDGDEVYRKNRNLEFNLNDQKYKQINPITMDLLRKMLAVQPSQRLSASDALKHKYFGDQKHFVNITGKQTKQSNMKSNAKSHGDTKSTLDGAKDFLHPVKNFNRHS